MSETQATFLPFHAINEFMRQEYRLNVIRSVLEAAPTLPEHHRKHLESLTRRHVKVPGFRNSEKAPLVVRLLPTIKAFEKSPELTAAILAAWVDLHAELRQQVYAVLQQRSWPLLSIDPSDAQDLLAALRQGEWGLLPPDIDRTRLPGFFSHWPAGESFEALYQTFTELYPDAAQSIDNVSLMVVWLGARLPYQVDEPSTSSTESSDNMG